MQLVVPNAVSAAVPAAIIILRRISQILFFFIALCVFKLLINRVNCVCIMVLDHHSYNYNCGARRTQTELAQVC